MASRISTTKTLVCLIVLVLWLPNARAGQEVLELFVGEWDVHQKTTHPMELEVSYSEMYAWVLDHRFVRGETERLPDGTKSIFYGTYDPSSDSYPFWWFMSSGLYSLAPAGKWDATSRTLTWKSAPVSDTSFELRVTFTDDRTRRWTYVVKQLLGTVLRQEGVAIRRDVASGTLNASEHAPVSQAPALPEPAPIRSSGLAELTPQMLSILLFLVIIVAPIITMALSALFLWSYRRSVIRQMQSHGGFGDSSAQRESTVPAPGGKTLEGGAVGRALYRDAVRGPWKVALRHFAAGFVLASVFAFAARHVYPFRLDLFGFLIGVLIYSWPIVPSLILIVPATWRGRSVLVAGYFAVFLALVFWAGGDAGLRAAQLGGLDISGQFAAAPAGTLWLWLVVNGMPTLAILLCFNRWARPVASLVLGFVTTAVCGILVAYLGLFSEFGFETTSAAAVALRMHPGWLVAGAVLVALTASGIIGWTLVRWISRKYRHGEISDQSLMLDALWLLFTSYYTMWLIFGGLKWAAIAPIAFAIYKLVLRIARAVTPRRSGLTRDLTFLRVFSLGRRSERLLDKVARYWRHIGNVRMITGPDLARSTVKPHQFLEFLSGRLAAQFVRDDASLDRSVAESNRTADADGSFSIGSFFCHADSWQRLLPKLVGKDDVVLMDLRKFTATNAGCLHELRYLAEAVPIERCLLVIDHTTDAEFLEQVLHEIWESLPPDSPNASRSPNEMPHYRFEGESGTERRLVRQLCREARDIL